MADKDNVAEIEKTSSREEAPPVGGPAATKGQSRGLVPPEIIMNMTPEKREELEIRLKRKIDLRLMPSIIIMYILNYIDRYALSRL